MNEWQCATSDARTLDYGTDRRPLQGPRLLADYTLPTLRPKFPHTNSTKIQYLQYEFVAWSIHNLLYYVTGSISTCHLSSNRTALSVLWSDSSRLSGDNHSLIQVNADISHKIRSGPVLYILFSHNDPLYLMPPLFMGTLSEFSGDTIKFSEKYNDRAITHFTVCLAVWIR